MAALRVGLVLLILSGARPLSLASEPGPLWEVDLFNVAARLPYYRGSEKDRWYALPFPWLIYRGELLRVDREGIKGLLHEGRRLEMDVSFFGNPPVKNDDRARDGMPDLDGLVEVGPSVKWHFLERRGPDRLYGMAAVRGAISAGWEDGPDLDYQGVHGELKLHYANTSFFKPSGLSFGLTAGMDWVDDRLNRYFYDVPEPCARPGREAFRSGGGFAGFSFMVSGHKRLTEKLRISVFTRWEHTGGAVYEESPLAGRSQHLSLGCALIWQMAASEKKARQEAGDDVP